MALFNFFTAGVVFLAVMTTSFFLIFLYSKKDSIYNLGETTNYTYSIIIPAYNEEKNIESCIGSVLRQDYPKDKFEIYVVDDGSTDRTREICKGYEKRGKINLIEKEHEGKVPSVNQVLERVESDLFCVLDADTFFHDSDILKKIGSYFDDEDIAATLTTIQIKKPDTWVEKVQMIEYFLSAFMRKIVSLFNGLYTTHGASFYRTSAVKEVGQFDESNLVEDMEMTLRLIDNGYKLGSDLQTVSYTIPPKDFKGFFQQRLRWYTGFIENVRDYRHMLFNKKYVGIGLISFPLAIVWMAIMVISIFWFGFQFISGNILRLKMLLETNWDVIFFLKTFFGSLRIGIYDFITVFGLSVSFLVAYLGYKLVEGTERSEFSLSYIYYFFIFGFVQGVFWLASLLNFIRPREEQPWKGKT